MTISLTPDARARLDAHLDAVERALVASGHTRESRRGIVDDLEAQILDMLAAKSSNPALEDVEAVLATLDPPAAYGENAPPVGGKVALIPQVPGATLKPRYSRTAIWGLACILISMLPLPLLLIASIFFRDYHSSGPAWKQMLLFVPCTGVFGLAGTVLGWIAFFQILGSRGAIRGTGLALFEGLFLLIPMALAFVVFMPVIAIPVLGVGFVILIMVGLLIRFGHVPSGLSR